MQINMPHRAILRIIIHAHKRELITNRIHPRKPGRQRVVVAEAVGIQAGAADFFFTVVSTGVGANTTF